MKNVRMLVGGTLIEVASILGLNIAQVAHADTCVTVAPTSGNPHWGVCIILSEGVSYADVLYHLGTGWEYHMQQTGVKIVKNSQP